MSPQLPERFIRPFIKCPGGKRKVAHRITQCFTAPMRRYVEPFLGGGAVFFALATRLPPEQLDCVVLGDADEDLIALYEAVRTNPYRLRHETHRIADHIGAHEEYRTERARWNRGGRWRTPARHLALRYAAFNGLWRVSLEGRMNTPWRKAPAVLPPLDVFEEAARVLRPCHLAPRSFRAYDAAKWGGLPLMREGTTVFIDPPYLGGFVAYTQAGWTGADCVDLFKLMAKWSRQGAHVVMTHVEHPLIEELVAKQWPDARIAEMPVARPINSDGGGRQAVRELIIYSGDRIS